MSWDIFTTRWGWAGIYTSNAMLLKTVLPTSREILANTIEKTGQSARFISDHDNSIGLVNKIRSFYSGEIITDWEICPDLSELPPFSRNILEYVFTIPYGHTLTYGQVAMKTGYARAARAIGQVMKRNPMPLIIPCHRVVSANGPGGFSAPGGIKTKNEMLALERKTISMKSL